MSSNARVKTHSHYYMTHSNYRRFIMIGEECPEVELAISILHWSADVY